jgi:small multidrug resistance pump
MGWVLLSIATVAEVAATISLKVATDGRKLFYIPVALGYLVAFSLLAVALTLGPPIGIAYGVWAASGVALTAVLGRLLFKEPLTLLMGAGIGRIIVVLVLVEIGH